MSGEREGLIEHHTHYKEIDGYDETVWISPREHSLLHNRLRREGKCNIPADELEKISRAAFKRGHPKYMEEYYKEKREEILNQKTEYYKENQEEIKEKKKIYTERNRDKINAYYREYHRKKREEAE